MKIIIILIIVMKTMMIIIVTIIKGRENRIKNKIKNWKVEKYIKINIDNKKIYHNLIILISSFKKKVTIIITEI